MKRFPPEPTPAEKLAVLLDANWIRPEATGGKWKFATRGTYAECVAAMCDTPRGTGLEFNIRPEARNESRMDDER